ncbi:MAG: DUF721 domain-containing protein [Myxococcales bacterium FL481]|nr:MAG: DUF721 domain-containing protein [Myxococcales bacterium FL481]
MAKRRAPARGQMPPDAVKQLVWGLLRSRMGGRDYAVAKLRARWTEITRPAGGMAPICWPARIDGHTLVLDVVNSQWLHELRYYENDLVARTCSACPDLEIERLAFQVSRRDIPGAPQSPVPSAAASPRPGVLASEPPRETVDALLAVRDPELRGALASARVVLGRTRSRTTPR